MHADQGRHLRRVPEFKGRGGEVDAAEADTTRATARLPGLDIEIVHRRAVEGDAEEISINLRAAPSFEAFGRALEAANLFAFWRRVHIAWLRGSRSRAPCRCRGRSRRRGRTGTARRIARRDGALAGLTDAVRRAPLSLAKR